MNLGVHYLFDKATSTLTYVVWDKTSRDAVIIDPVLNYDPATQITSLESKRKISHFLKAEDLRVHMVLETHAHADHLSSAPEFKKSGEAAEIVAGDSLKGVYTIFAKVFGWPKEGGLKDIDRFCRDGEEFTAGSIRIQALATPGHTSACTTFRIGSWLFTGDVMFMPDGGVGRCDFPGGSASTLYDSVWGKIFAMPENFEIFVGHDYQPGGRSLRYRTTVGEQRQSNIHLRESTSKADFVAFREARDKTLTAPRLLNPALDWNLGAHQIVKPS